ncbi:helix-turn-helix domain-containing protein [Actinomadura sp. DC4]|uniref:winged helix-turn-helix transcriptional regulator n=1 Tax=Actinomadura sp. DC4 TaxID=3055069 RepID=UPI0025AF8C7B|nr:helix-turn-helix domain-containing protein [Actinomadura sp. DC4]MDN3352247.1 helix-turn-helix domain-containing protein [Actinomadura sp. DC4]
MGESCERASEELTQVFALLGKRWSGLVVAVLTGGPVRFADLRRAIPGISERMLSDRLSELADSGLVVREVLEGPPLGVCYRLTPAGLALRPALEELSRWAHEHLRPSLL